MAKLWNIPEAYLWNIIPEAYLWNTPEAYLWNITCVANLWNIPLGWGGPGDTGPVALTGARGGGPNWQNYGIFHLQNRNIP